MAQIAQPQVRRISIHHYRFVVASLIALIAAAAVVVVLVAGSGGGTTSSPEQSGVSLRSLAGPATGTPAAVSQALDGHESSSGRNVSLTTNVPAPPRLDVGPTSGTPAAVRQALVGR
jgi:hypothetical protein